jgi:hypothetical protein
VTGDVLLFHGSRALQFFPANQDNRAIAQSPV